GEGRDLGEIRRDRRDVEPALAGKVRHAEAAAEIQRLHRPGSERREPDRELEALALRFDDRVALEVLRAREDMEPFEREPCIADPRERLRHLLGVDAEL